MASTILPNGIIIPEKYSRDWYNDLYHNWQELDNLLAGGGANDGTLTIQKNGTTVGTFSANQATDETINITVQAVNDATLTIQQNGTTVDSFTANSSTDKTVNIQCVDLTNNQTVGGVKTFSSKINGTIDKSKDYYLSDDTLASANGSLGTVKYYPATNTADLDTEIFEHSLWAATKVVNISPTLDSFYYIDQYFYGQRTATSNRIQILRGYRNANLQLVRVYNGSKYSWSEWAKFADDSNVVHKRDNETVGGIKTFSDAPVVSAITLDGKTIDTDANDNMTFNGNKVLTNANLTFSYDSATETLTVTY